ncbi:hypothetical protein HK096_009984, partial [Nowakowskiella sp. JEL0078]
MSFQGDITFWEVLNIISVKKELVPSHHVIKIHFNDGTEKQAEEIKSIDYYQNLDRLIVEQTIFPDPLKVPALKARRTSIITSTSQKPSNVRTTEFPKTLTDTEMLSTKLAGMKTSSDYTTKTLRPQKSSKSLSMRLFKKGADGEENDQTGSESSLRLSLSSLNSRPSDEKVSPLDITEELLKAGSAKDDMLGELMTSLSPSIHTPESMFSSNRGSYVEKSIIGGASSFEDPMDSLHLGQMRQAQDGSKKLSEDSFNIGSVASLQSLQSLPANIKQSSLEDLDSDQPAKGVLSPMEKQLRKRTISTPTSNGSSSPSISMRRSPLHKGASKTTATITKPIEIQESDNIIESPDGFAPTVNVKGVQYLSVKMRTPDDKVTLISIPHQMTME